MVRKTVSFAVVACLLVSTSIVAGVGAASNDETSNAQLATQSHTAQTDGPETAVDASRVGETGTIEYTMTIEATPELEYLSVILGTRTEVVETTGVERVSTDGRTRFRWDGETDQPRIVIRTDLSADTSSQTGEYVRTDEWLLGRVPFVEMQWRTTTTDGLERARPLGDDFDALADTETESYGDRYALVGPQRTRTRTADNQQFRLVTPTGTDVKPGDEEVLSALASASAHLDVGDRSDETLVIAVPEPARRGGESFPVRNEAWVNAAEPLDDPNNVWLHEYVHTRQDFQLSDEMAWFREASAEYYGARLASEQGRISERAMTEHLSGDSQEATLTDQSTWETEHVPYRKGARVLALLDRNIRFQTDDDRSLQDVFRRMNRHEGTVTYAEFKRIVAAVTGQPMDPWLDRYVAGETPVASFYGQSARVGLFGAIGWTADSPGDAFVVVSTLISLVTAVPLYLFLRRFETTDTAAGRQRHS